MTILDILQIMSYSGCMIIMLIQTLCSDDIELRDSNLRGTAGWFCALLTLISSLI